MNGNPLYKYRSLYKEDGSLNKFTWKLLFNGEIYLSDFESLNDPCEGQIIPRYRDITKEKILKIHPWMDTMPLCMVILGLIGALTGFYMLYKQVK